MSDLKTYEFNVAMSCSGCSGAVERVLKRWQDKEYPDLTYSTDLETQTVKVTAPASVPYDDIYTKINNVKPVSAGKEIEA